MDLFCERDGDKFALSWHGFYIRNQAVSAGASGAIFGLLGVLGGL